MKNVLTMNVYTLAMIVPLLSIAPAHVLVLNALWELPITARVANQMIPVARNADPAGVKLINFIMTLLYTRIAREKIVKMEMR